MRPTPLLAVAILSGMVWAACVFLLLRPLLGFVSGGR